MVWQFDMISTIEKSKSTFTLAIIIWFHRPVLSYNKRQSRTGQMCSHMIFISFFVGNKFGASKECVHNSPVNLRSVVCLSKLIIPMWYILLGRTLVFTLYKFHNGMRSNKCTRWKNPLLRRSEINFHSYHVNYKI